MSLLILTLNTDCCLLKLRLPRYFAKTMDIGFTIGIR